MRNANVFISVIFQATPSNQMHNNLWKKWIDVSARFFNEMRPPSSISQCTAVSIPICRRKAHCGQGITTHLQLSDVHTRDLLAQSRHEHRLPDVSAATQHLSTTAILSTCSTDWAIWFSASRHTQTESLVLVVSSPFGLVANICTPRLCNSSSCSSFT